MTFLLALAGCASPQPDGPCYGRKYDTGWEETSPAANLALGPSLEHAQLATLFNDRSDWPSLFDGYRSDTTSIYTRVFVNHQYTYGQFGGFTDFSQSVESTATTR